LARRPIFVADPLGAHPADQSLGTSVPVDVSRVETGDPGIGRGVQGGDGVVLADRAPLGAELPAAQPDHAEFAAQPFPPSLFHAITVSRGDLRGRGRASLRPCP
jgi:hypothetical protein